jgi:hypothetical protein
MRELQRRQQKRMRQAFRPGTVANQLTQIRTYLRFCLSYGLQDLDPVPQTLALYIEHLAQRFKSPRSVKNYVAAVTLLHKLLAIPFSAAQSFQVSLMLRAISTTMRHTPHPKSPVSVPILLQLCQACDTLGLWGAVLKCVILFAFFAFLRQSNLAPPHAGQFHPSRHTTRGDVHLSPSGLSLSLKWTKTLQAPISPIYIPLPTIPGSPLCPVRAYTLMVSQVPTPAPTAPLFLMPSATGKLTVVAIPQLRSSFSKLVSQLHLSSKDFSLHSLRRGGATLAFQSGVPLEVIKAHGTWTSDSVWGYLKPPTQLSALPQALARAVRPPPSTI